MKKQTVYVVYFSPAGTTRQVADAVAKESSAKGANVVRADLAFGAGEAKDIGNSLAPGDILFVGSPTYAGHPVPVVMDFLSGLPATPGVYAAPFVTYGMVTSGLALLDMARAMEQKDFLLVGGMKVAAVHSMLWSSAKPLGKGRPDESDLAKAVHFTNIILDKAATGEPQPLPLETFDYQRQEVREKVVEGGLQALKPVMLPFDLDEDACTGCGMCADNCPAGNITLDPLPMFADRCVLCFNCIRVCEPGALSSKVLPFIEPEILKKAEFFKEPGQTQLFV